MFVVAYKVLTSYELFVALWWLAQCDSTATQQDDDWQGKIIAANSQLRSIFLSPIFALVFLDLSFMLLPLIPISPWRICPYASSFDSSLSLKDLSFMICPLIPISPWTRWNGNFFLCAFYSTICSCKNLQMYPKDIVLVYFLAEVATSNLEAAAAAVVVCFHLSNDSRFNFYLDATT